MSTAVAPRLGACPEYQRLLDSCQQALAMWQRRHTLSQHNSPVPGRVREELLRLQEDYARVYDLLEHHEAVCQTCQYIAKVGGLDFESMSNALNRQNAFR